MACSWCVLQLAFENGVSFCIAGAQSPRSLDNVRSLCQGSNVSRLKKRESVREREKTHERAKEREKERERERDKEMERSARAIEKHTNRQREQGQRESATQTKQKILRL